MIRTISAATRDLKAALETLHHVADHPAVHRLTADEWENLAENIRRVAEFCQRHANQLAALTRNEDELSL